MTKFAGIEGQAEGANRNLHFAGEHTAGFSGQGYMDGATQTGELAAQEILEKFDANDIKGVVKKVKNF
ncbi:hypothetical protein BK714_28260 [Bacillus thuringiensis serovar oswaldocruzi]|nr:hypothetical protein BK714_28260 [Bacillus thuringiensis serovar oswaldocruzi]